MHAWDAMMMRCQCTHRNEGGAELEELERVCGWLVVVSVTLVAVLQRGQVLEVQQVRVVLSLIQLQIHLDLPRQM